MKLQKNLKVKKSILNATALVSSLCILTPNIAANAQDEDESRFDNIVVTSKRIEQNIYEAPVAVTVFDTDSLEKRNANNLIDIGKYVPNLTVTTFGAGNPSSHLIVIDPTVGVYVDGVYLGRQIGQNLNLANIERIEVLRGPQGTLFGRNSIGGAINIITQQPGDVEVAEVNLQGGTRGRFNGSFYGNTKLSDTLAVSANFGIDRRNGIGDFLNVTNPEARVGELQDIFGRVSLKWQPSSQFSLLLSADGNTFTGGQSPFQTTFFEPDGGCTADDVGNQFGAFAPACFAGLDASSQSADPFDTNSGQADLARTASDAYGFSGTATYDFSEALILKLIGSYHEGGLDDDGAEIDFLSFPEVGEAEQFSIEAQVSGRSGILDYVGGIYYFEEEGNNFQLPVTFNGGTNGTFEQTQETTSFAVFANIGAQVTDALRVSGGLRFTDDSKDATANVGFAPVFGNEADFSEVTWEASATYALGSNLNVFATAARGYQSGQFPARPFFAAFANDLFVATAPVIATNYEAGLKGEPFPWLQLSLSAFYTDYSDYPAQISFVDDTGFNTITDTADARSFGVEWEGNISLGNFLLNTSVGYIDAEFTDVPAAPSDATVNTDLSIDEGDALPLTPRWTVAIGPQYTFPVENGDIVARLDYSYRGDLEGQPNNDPLAQIDSRFLLGFNITYFNTDANWSVGVYGKNITDERYVQSALNVGPYLLNVLSNDASEFGVKFSKTFGGN